MGVFSFFGRKGTASDRPLRAEAGPHATPTSPYSAQYETIVAQGHEQPTPVFAAPALVWHVGVWPRAEFDPHLALGATTPVPRSWWRSLWDPGALDPEPEASGLSLHDRALHAYAMRRYSWIEDINGRLGRIAERGRTRVALNDDGTPMGTPKRFLPNDRPPAHPMGRRRRLRRELKPPTKTAGKRQARVETGSVTMTLWWPNEPGGRAEDPDAIRVRMHCHLTPDYVTYSFYLDVTTAWDDRKIEVPSALGTTRRDRLLKALAEIDRQCVPTADGAHAPLLPERGIDDQALLAARNLLYVKIWEELASAWGCRLDELAHPLGEVFANFRGLVLKTGSVSGSTDFDRFSQDPRFGVDGTEANAIVNAYWPFMRRITPWADYREYVVCGVMNWRALYMTALGSHSLYDEGEERKTSPAEDCAAHIGVRDEVVSGRAEATLTDDTCVRPRQCRPGYNHPVRYLVLTKGTPEPRQLGRILERINTLGTLRLYALKDWAVIEAADNSIRILGQQLDEVTRDWSDKRDLVEALRDLGHFRRALNNKYFELIHGDLEKIPTYGRFSRGRRALFNFLLSVATVGLMRQHVRNNRKNAVLDSKYALLSEIADGLEARLIRINSDLDRAGVDASGGLHFRINRSRYHVKEFYRLVKLLQIGNVQTWTSYSQFVARGLAPAFDFIDNVGRRIQALRLRLTSVTDTIEAGALVGQSSATRYNTAVLRQVLIIMSAVFAIYLLKAYMPQALTELLDWFGKWFQDQTQWLLKSLFDWLRRHWDAAAEFIRRSALGA